MAKPKAYEPELTNAKQVFLKVITYGNDTELAAVDHEGDHITTLLMFLENEILAVDGACEDLASAGFDVSFCEWTANGAAVIKH